MSSYDRGVIRNQPSRAAQATAFAVEPGAAASVMPAWRWPSRGSPTACGLLLPFAGAFGTLARHCAGRREIRPPGYVTPLMSPVDGLTAIASSFTSLRNAPNRPDPAHDGGVPRRTSPAVPARQVVPGAGDFWGGEERSVRVGERSALRPLTCRRLSERSERSERSEIAGTTRTRAPQCSRRSRPPQHEPAPGTACRAAHTPPRSAKPTFAKRSSGPKAIAHPRTFDRQTA
jgi:hypothetical protein